MDMLKNTENVKDPKTLVNVLQKEFDFKIEMIDSVYKLAKYLYECGNYLDSIPYLYFCLLVMQPSDKVNILLFFL